MPRLVKLVLLGFLAYAVATASDEQQSAMIAGGLAVRDAVAEACTRQGSLCAEAISSLGARFTPSSAGTTPWLDDPAKRPTKPERTGEVVGR
ncbi:MAG: hypothetical protein AB1749_00325 [Pseudomonadota bacterium]